MCISDTHGKQIHVPDGDVLVHAGDSTGRGSEREIRAFDAWLGTLPHRHKVVIAGNHDFGFQDIPGARGWVTNAVYLEDELVEVGGLRIYGSPWQPRFFDWAFNLDRGAPLREKWDMIPEKVDVLVTHGPPEGILDRCADGRRVGCEELLLAVRRKKPRVHVFGHIHEAYGQEEHDGTVFVNASTCNLEYRAVNAPVVIDLEPAG